jgi:hypothetical protein
MSKNCPLSFPSNSTHQQLTLKRDGQRHGRELHGNAGKRQRENFAAGGKWALKEFEAGGPPVAARLTAVPENSSRCQPTVRNSANVPEK